MSLAALLSKRRKIAFTVGPAAAYLVASSSYTPAAGDTVTITAQLVDANNHAVATSGLTVTWSKSDPGGSFGSPTSLTDVNGIATVSFTTSATPATATTVTGTDGSAHAGTSATITTQSAGGGAAPAYFAQDAFAPDAFAGAFFP